MTAYHVFNIGSPHNSEWWAQNLDRGVITAGFDGEPGDRGEVILRDMDEGDWIIAYANGHGYVGAGKVQGVETYQLHSTLPVGSLSDHHHEREVAWLYFVEDIANAITLLEARRQQPRQTKERESNEDIANHIIALLQERRAGPLLITHGGGTGKYDRLRWEIARDAVLAFGRPAKVSEIREVILAQHPDYNTANLRPDLSKLSVNCRTRVHYQSSSVGRLTDTGSPYDCLFKTKDNGNVRYERYEVAHHGVWALEFDAGGRGSVSGPVMNPMAKALVEAVRWAESESLPAIDSTYDGRVWALTAVVQRRGQPAFRANLLSAYGNICAVTGCDAVEVLEAAHIIPYRGDHSNRVDNGLLLRADIHTLFDLGQLWIDPDTATVQLKTALRASAYGALHGTQLRLPSDSSHHPKREHLLDHMLVATSGVL
jgi:putative restriction endonuclease